MEGLGTILQFIKDGPEVGKVARICRGKQTFNNIREGYTVRSLTLSRLKVLVLLHTHLFHMVEELHLQHQEIRGRW